MTDNTKSLNITSPIIINDFVDVNKINRTIYFRNNLEILREKFPNVCEYIKITEDIFA